MSTVEVMERLIKCKCLSSENLLQNIEYIHQIRYTTKDLVQISQLICKFIKTFLLKNLKFRGMHAKGIGLNWYIT